MVEIMTEIQHAQVQYIPGVCRNCCHFYATEHYNLCRRTRPKGEVVSEDDFCGKFKCATWALRKDQQGRMLLPIKVFHPNHPDYFKLFPSDDDASTKRPRKKSITIL